MAFAELCPRRPELVLVICGPDHQEGHYQRLAAGLGLEGRVSFVGEKTAAEVQALIGRCLLLVLPSRHETFGMALLEAMARGKPVVASAVGGIPELVSPSAGLLVPPHDVAALAEALERLAADPELRAALGRGASARASSYPWSRAALAYQRAF
jgi:2-deoxystreptamine N-acetyl-D-glucosaminyltransferase/2-deoxystreptamine glucosyltransferase